MKNNSKNKNIQIFSVRKYLTHPYQIVNFSPWPAMVSLSVLCLLISLTMIFYHKIAGSHLFFTSLLLLNSSIFLWTYEIIQEGVFKGEHTKIVQYNLLYGFILFVISELSIFTGLFIAFFYHSFVPSVEIGSIWPPLGIYILNPESTPLFNTMVLYGSGLTITIAQNYLSSSFKSTSIFYLLLTIVLGLLFSYLQYIEYFYTSFNISDSVYSTCFFLLTGFHGFHVLLGTSLLIISYIRLILNHFSTLNPIGFNVSAIYWHFVDYIWLILFAALYCWAS